MHNFLFIFIILYCSIMASAQDDVHLLYEPNAPDYKKASVQSLFDKIAPDPSLSTFLDVLTGVEDIFQLINATHKQELTIFCPINGAFHDHVESTRENLKEFLQYHIVPSYIEPDNLKRVDTLKTLLDDEAISVSYHFFSQRIVLNDLATVDTVHTTEAVNGIAYKIDHLLLRPTVSA